MRVFFGIRLSSKVKEIAATTQSNLSTKGNFTSYDNLHITLRFIGSVTMSELEDLKDCLYNISFNSFDILINDIGYFNSRGKYTLFLKVESDELHDFYSKLEAELVKFGFDKENRNYKPHITLVREAQNINSGSIIPTNMHVNEIALIESKRVNGQLIYEDIYKVILR